MKKYLAIATYHDDPEGSVWVKAVELEESEISQAESVLADEIVGDAEGYADVKFVSLEQIDDKWHCAAEYYLG